VDEASWEWSRDPGMMLQCVRGSASARKLRLFACACWRIVAGPVNPLLGFLERLADDPTADLAVVGPALPKKDLALLSDPWETARDAIAWKPSMARRAVQHQFKRREVKTEACWEAWTAAQWEWAALVREIFGFRQRPVEVQHHWPLNVVELATAIYGGQDCAFALHDALTEAGEAELAEHFAVATPQLSAARLLPDAADVVPDERVRRLRWHPKGCWVADLILGKK
jgi:hypothetical protein